MKLPIIYCLYIESSYVKGKLSLLQIIQAVLKVLDLYSTYYTFNTL